MKLPPGLDRFDLPGEGNVIALEGLGPAWVASALRVHRDNTEPSRVLKKNLGTLVTRVAVDPLPRTERSDLPSEVVVKEAPGKSRLPGLFAFLGLRSQFARDFTIGPCIAERGILSPRALACTCRPRGPTEVIVSEFVAGATPLRDLLWLGDRVVSDAAKRDMLLERMGSWLRGVHEKGVWQRDMKPSNVLSRGGDFILVDITAVRLFHRPLDERRRLRNIAQLLDLTPDLDGEPRNVLLGAYLGSTPGGAAALGAWAKGIDRLIEARRDYRQSQCGFRYVDEEHFRRARAPEM